MLNRLKQLKNKEDGFTIIEVLIVLAIAALILVIVLIAIPQLQRNQRNTSRQSDASRLLTTVNDWSANNNGRAITTGTVNDNLNTVINSIGGNPPGTMGQYTLTAGTTLTAVQFTTLTVNNAINNLDNMRIVTGATCGNDGNVVSGAARQHAVQFAAETGNGTVGRCQSS